MFARCGRYARPRSTPARGDCSLAAAALGVPSRSIEHRIARGPAVPRAPGGLCGRPARAHRVMDAGWRRFSTPAPGRCLSHESAAALWELEDREAVITISLPSPKQYRGRGLKAHSVEARTRRPPPSTGHPADSSPARTLIDLATTASPRRLEPAINAADRPTSRSGAASGGDRGAARAPRRPGFATSSTAGPSADRFRASSAGFCRLARSAGLPKPADPAVGSSGYEVDFHWPDLGLVVETDGLRYHRTPAQHDGTRRDQAHAA